MFIKLSFMRRISAILVLTSVFTVFGCGTGSNMVGSNSSRGPVSTNVVGVVGGTQVFLDELVSQYERNNITGEKPDTTRIRELAEFLDLYLLYRAKLMEAEEKGLFVSDDIIKELRQYELQYAIPYWIENEIQDKLIDEYIFRNKREIDATHILIAVPEGASPSDTLHAYNQLIEARNKFLAGEDFEKLSNEYSTIFDGRSMGGPLGYFSAGWAVKPFEDAAFSLEVGQVSMPFSTQFGYHIVLVKDIRERRMDRFVSHIYFNARGGTQEYGDSLFNVASELYRRLENGADWAQMVQQYSQDQRSLEFDGQIGWINYGAYDNSFTDPVFAVPTDQIGKARPPIQTVYGIHVIKVDSVRTYSDTQVERAEALAALRNLPSFRDQRGLVLNRIRQEVKEFVFLDNVRLFHGMNSGRDTVRVASSIIPADVASRVIYELGSENYTIGDYHEFIKVHSPSMTWSGVNDLLFDAFKDKMVEEKLLEITNERYSDYRSTIQNYLEGLAVFKLTEDEVWNYSRTDTASLVSLYESNRGDYQFPRRYDVVRMAARTDSLLNAAQIKITSGMSPDSLRNDLQGLSVVRETISDLSNEPFNKLQGLSSGNFTSTFDFRSTRNLLYLEKIREPELMTFDEAFFRLVSEYQPIRENTWNNHLRQKFRIQSYPANIR
jgi:peptidyl-prolyl cis-trans isomerase SurA